jgi:hypothetical protein
MMLSPFLVLYDFLSQDYCSTEPLNQSREVIYRVACL